MDSSSLHRTVLLPIFGGQLSDSKDVSNRHLQHASSPAGAVLLDACFAAFHTELLSLGPDLVQQVGICASDFKRKVSLLRPIHDDYLCNPIVSNTTLLLMQALKYLHSVECFQPSPESNEQFTKVLQVNSNYKVGVLGFSLGMLTATTVAASRSNIDFINRAAEAYRLAFWIGLRSLLYRSKIHSFSTYDVRPWAVDICFDNAEVQKAVLAFNKVFFL